MFKIFYNSTNIDQPEWACLCSFLTIYVLYRLFRYCRRRHLFVLLLLLFLGLCFQSNELLDHFYRRKHAITVAWILFAKIAELLARISSTLGMAKHEPIVFWISLCRKFSKYLDSFQYWATSILSIRIPVLQRLQQTWRLVVW